MKGEKIGEDKCGEQWSLDEHSYVWVPKWVVEQVREVEREEVVDLPDFKSLIALASPESEHMSDGERITHFCILVRQLKKTLTKDTPPITNNKN